MTLPLFPVVLGDVPVPAFDAAVTHLADVLRECQLVLVGCDQGGSDDAAMVDVARALVPEIEELREIWRSADITVVGDRYRVEAEMRSEDAAMMARLQAHLVQLRLLGPQGSMLVADDAEVARFLAWMWDEVTDQLSGAQARPYRRA